MSETAQSPTTNTRRQAGLRIAVLANRFPALSETFVIDQVAGFLEAGHDVTVFSAQATPEECDHALIDRHQLTSITCYGTEIPAHQTTRLAAALRALRRAPGHDRPYLLRALDPRLGVRSALSLRPYLETQDHLPPREFDILHCHFGPLGIRALRQRTIGTLSGRLAVTFHGMEMSQYRHLLSTREYRLLFDQGDLFLPVSERWRQRLLQAGCPPERTHVHHMGVRVEDRPIAPLTHQGPPRLLSVGRLVEKKGFAYAIAAVGHIRDRHPDLEYIIVGEGPLRAALAQQIRDLELTNTVRLLGSRSNEEVQALMADADMLIAPSVTSATGDMEGIPVVLMEAMAAGLPVVSTFHSGIPELVEHGVTGFLVPERDSAALAEELITVLRRPDDLHAIRQAARTKVETDFNSSILNGLLVERFRSTLE